jgi:superfamily I DNA/RNA helicase
MKYYMEGTTTVFSQPWYEEFCRLKASTIEYYRDLIAGKVNLNECKIKLNTVHGSKGGEADNVVLLLGFSSRIAENMHSNPDSEMRCYYVGVTRARKKLYLVTPEGNHGYEYLGGYSEQSI